MVLGLLVSDHMINPPLRHGYLSMIGFLVVKYFSFVRIYEDVFSLGSTETFVPSSQYLTDSSSASYAKLGDKIRQLSARYKNTSGLRGARY